MRILRSAKASAEFRVITWTGNRNIKEDAESTYTAGSGDMARARVTTAEVRVMEIVVTVVEADIRL